MFAVLINFKVCKLVLCCAHASRKVGHISMLTISKKYKWNTNSHEDLWSFEKIYSLSFAQTFTTILLYNSNCAQHMGKNLLGDQDLIPYVLKNSWVSLRRQPLAAPPFSLPAPITNGLRKESLGLTKWMLQLPSHPALVPLMLPTPKARSRQDERQQAALWAGVRIRLPCPQGLFFLRGSTRCKRAKWNQKLAPKYVIHTPLFW